MCSCSASPQTGGTGPEQAEARTDAELSQGVKSGQKGALWYALGGMSERPQTPVGVDSRVFWHLSSKPVEQAERVTPDCSPVSSILPSPDGRYLFAVVDGSLHVMPGDPSDAETPRKIEVEPGLVFEHLLAFFRKPGSLEMLASARADGRGRAKVWRLDITDSATSARARPWVDRAAVANIQSFLQSFLIPRCLMGSKNCLVVTQIGDRGVLDSEPTRGSDRRSEEAYEGKNMDIRDAAWAQASGARARWLVVGCKLDDWWEGAD